MEPWIYILAGIGLFGAFFPVVNIAASKFDANPYQRPVAFGWFFILMTSLPIILFQEVRDLWWVQGVLSGLVFVAISVVLGWYWKYKISYTTSSIYGEKPFILSVSPVSAVLKCVDIVLQQACAYLIVFGLLSFDLPLWAVIIIFTVSVFFMHLPSETVFGKFIGRYFLFVSTGLSFLLPLAIAYDARLIYATYILHVVGYWVLYYLVWRYTIRQ